MILRDHYRKLIKKALGRSKITAILGPRQCGKTTIAQEIASELESHFFDMDSPGDRARLQNPELYLSGLSGLIIIDEIQNAPELFPVLRIISDRATGNGRFKPKYIMEQRRFSSIFPGRLRRKQHCLERKFYSYFPATGLSDKTIRSYINILSSTYMVRQLQPWFENLKKRQVQSPKIYFTDTGLLHHLLGIENYHSLLAHPQVGVSWNSQLPYV